MMIDGTNKLASKCIIIRFFFNFMKITSKYSYLLGTLSILQRSSALVPTGAVKVSSKAGGCSLSRTGGVGLFGAYSSLPGSSPTEKI